MNRSSWSLDPLDRGAPSATGRREAPGQVSRRFRPQLLPMALLVFAMGCCSDGVAHVPEAASFLIELRDGWGEFEYLAVSLAPLEVTWLDDGCDERWDMFEEVEGAEADASAAWQARWADRSAEAAEGVPNETLGAVDRVDVWKVDVDADAAVGCRRVSTADLVEVLLRSEDSAWSAVALPADEDRALRNPVRFRPGHDQVALGVTTRSLRLIRSIGLFLVDTRTGDVVREWEPDANESAVAGVAFTSDGGTLVVLRRTVHRPRGFLDDFLRELGHGRQKFEWTLDVHDLEAGTVATVSVQEEGSSWSGHLLRVGGE